MDFSPTVEETAQCYNTVVHNSGSETDVTYVVKLVRITLIDRKCLVNKIILYMKIKKIIIIPILGIWFNNIYFYNWLVASINDSSVAI